MSFRLLALINLLPNNETWYIINLAAEHLKTRGVHVVEGDSLKALKAEKLKGAMPGRP